MNRLLLIIGVLGTIFLALIIFAVSIMGDRSCRIEIKNGGNNEIILKTFRITRYDKQLTVDSINLHPQDKLEIGHCILCSTVDTTEIEFDAIGFYDNETRFMIMKKKELIDYLATKEKVDCATFILR